MSDNADALKFARGLISIRGKDLASEIRKEADAIRSAVLDLVQANPDVQDRISELAEIAHQTVEAAAEKVEDDLGALIAHQRFK